MENRNNYLNNINKLVAGDEKDFLDSELNVRALKDFRFLCSKTNVSYMKNVNFETLKSADHTKIYGDFLVIGHQGAGTVAFPKKIIDVDNPSMYVAVVVYKNDAVQDVYVFAALNFKKTGLFSIFKDKKDEFGIEVGNEKKLKQYSFGYVLKNI